MRAASLLMSLPSVSWRTVGELEGFLTPTYTNICIYVYRCIFVCSSSPRCTAALFRSLRCQTSKKFSNFQISSPKALDFQISSLDFQISGFPDFQISRFSNCQPQGSRCPMEISKFPNVQISKGWKFGNLYSWKSRALGLETWKSRALGLELWKF